MRYDIHGNAIIDNLNQVDGFIRDREKKAEKDKLYFMNNGSVTVDHMATAQALIDFISSTPGLDKHVREILILRIGNPAVKGKRMSHTAIALAKGMKEEEVVFLERAGIRIVEAYMTKVTLADGAMAGVDNKESNEILNRVRSGNLKKTK